MKKILNFFKNNLLFFFILLLALFLRIYRLDSLTTFGGDQGQDFLVVKDMVLYHKWTLLGIKTSGYDFFQGPIYLYMLYPFFILFNLNPISGAIAAVFYSLLNIIILYILCLKFFSKRIAIISTLLFAVSPELIIFGNSPLYQHFLPLFIVISIYLFLLEKKNIFLYLSLGLSLGIGIELHLLNISLLAAIFIYFIFYEKINLKNLLSYISGIILGISPTIAFELRHNLLNTKYLFNYRPQNGIKFQLVDIIGQWFKGFSLYFGGNFIFAGILIFLLFILFIFNKKVSSCSVKLKKLTFILVIVSIILSIVFSALGHHYLIPFWIILLIVLSITIGDVLNNKLGIIIIGILVVLNLYSSLGRLNFNHGYSMPDGWTLKKIVYSGKIICQDSLDHQNFNVAALLDSVTRAYPLRYVVEICGSKPESVINYPSNNFLYIITRNSPERMSDVTTWEVTSFKPFRIGSTWDLGDGINLYRLDRILSRK